MKKIILLLIILILVFSGCSNMPESDNCDFLINATWEGSDESCTNSISFNEDGFFSNSCACGSPVGSGDVTEIFRYIEEGKSLLLYDCDEELIEEGKILFCDDTYLVVNLWGDTYCYQNIDSDYIAEVHNIALKATGTEEITKPCLAVLGLEDGVLTVSSYNYDYDAKDSFKTWQLPIADDFKCTSVSVTVENDSADIDVVTLDEDDLQYIGEYYTYGYFDFNEEGQVTNIVFYGENIIWS